MRPLGGRELDELSGPERLGNGAVLDREGQFFLRLQSQKVHEMLELILTADPGALDRKDQLFAARPKDLENLWNGIENDHVSFTQALCLLSYSPYPDRGDEFLLYHRNGHTPPNGF